MISISPLKLWLWLFSGILWSSLLSGCVNQLPLARVNPTATTPSPTLTPTPTPSPQATNKPEAIKTLESQLKTIVAQEIGVEIEAVNCPIEPATAVGKLDCQLVADRKPFVVTVNRTNDGKQFQWSTKGLLQLAKLEKFLQQRIKEQDGIEVKANCGGKIRAAQPGEAFECQLTDAQRQSRSVKVTVKDEQGSVNIALL